MRSSWNFTKGLLSAGLLLASLATPANAAKSQECAAKLRDFIRDLDYIMSLQQQSTIPLQSILLKYFPTEGCRVDETIAIARQSNFFWETYETVTSIGIHFRNETFKAGFAVETDSGNIVRPYVLWRVPYP
jgi:hypothetical protein